MCTSVGQLSVFAVSTIPSTGLRARFAIPVLKAREVTSKMAAPVVSEPVPAVVGTENRWVGSYRRTARAGTCLQLKVVGSERLEAPFLREH